jgi:hypothetical protein
MAVILNIQLKYFSVVSLLKSPDENETLSLADAHERI